ncbi:CoA transferase (plasmid) [Embleya sp. NBC_00888]|uniref:CaiB/BaiF CoA-transferase family protein n=1 Tax=Embleya sp. NBC_00888 TaxID=2975960 RepID=UPI002F919734|nr:CoA transferase [Embleya sp. NBC_00888]
MSSTAAPGALHGRRVLELGVSTAAAVTGMLFSDFGADVVLVERPDSGQRRRDVPGYAVWDRGKRSVCHPADDRRGRAWLARALAAADVCILAPNESLAAYGDQVVNAAEANHRLVVLEMPAYLAEGSPWLGDEESEAMLSAHTGVSWRQASQDGAPVDFVVPYLSHIQGVWAAACALAALVERERSGRGQHVTVTGVNAVMEASSYTLAVSPDAPDLDTAVGVLGRHPTYRAVRAADAWLACGALGPKFERAVLEVLGIADILDDPRLAGTTTNMVLPENVEWVMERVSAAFRCRPRDVWLRELEERGVPAGPVGSRDDWLDHPQVAANDLRVDVQDADRGTVAMPGVPLRFGRSPARVAGAAPPLGEHNDHPSWPPRESAAPAGPSAPSPGPLHGMRILDMGTFVATPYAGFLLAELGADVVKIEPTTGDPFRDAGFVFNRGMRSLAVDLRAEAGRRLVRRVCDGADALIGGMRPGVMAALGLDHAHLSTSNPDLVSVSLSAYGVCGPMADRGGVDMVVQAMSGMMSAQGDLELPIATTIAIIDVTAAALCALGVVAALLHRECSGAGQQVSASLVGAASLLESGDLVRFPGRAPTVRSGPDFKGPGPLDRYYPVSDGWVRLQSRDPRLTVDDVLGSAPGDPVDRMRISLADLDAREAIALLARFGIPAVRARRISEAVSDPRLRSAEFVHLRTATDGSVFATTGRHATFSRTQRSGPMSPPGIGEHTTAVLSEAGVGESDIRAALADGVAAEGGPVAMQLRAVYR